MDLRESLILVVEDNQVLKRTLAMCFDRLGAVAQIVDSANEAMALLDGGAPVDLLFSDIRLPGALDGVALAHWTQERYPQIRIVLQTAHSGYADLPFPILEKPYALDELRIALSTALADSP
ncbi:MAG: response regulator [Pseudomonadota bacterium]